MEDHEVSAQGKGKRGNQVKNLWLLGFCCAALSAWPAPERVVIDHRTYALLRYELTPSTVQSYGKSPENWWGTLRELDADAPQECDGFRNNGPACAPFVHNVIGVAIPADVAKASSVEAAKWLLGKVGR